MRILEVFGEPFSNGGQEAFVMNVLRHIDMNGLNIDFFTPYFCDNEHYSSVIKAKNGKIYAAGLDFRPGSSRIDIIKPLISFLKKEKYDTVHIHSGSISCLAYSALAARICGVKRIIVHSHSTGRKNSLKHAAVKLVTLPVMNLCPTDYMACSDAAGRWKFSDSICDRKLQIVKNGINVDSFAPDSVIRAAVRQELSVSDDCLLLGHVGRFSEEKNQSFLIDILDILTEKNINAKLLMIGSGETMGSVKEKTDLSGLSDKVMFIGSVSNVNDYMQAMDIFLFPSFFEGLGIAAVEAQASGLPVIVSDAVPQDVRLSENVHFLNLNDIDIWVSTILEYRRKIRFDNIKSIKDNGYDISSTAELMKNIYCGRDKI